MSGISRGALVPRDGVLGLDDSARGPGCHSSPYLGQFMLLRKIWAILRFTPGNDSLKIMLRIDSQCFEFQLFQNFQFSERIRKIVLAGIKRDSFAGLHSLSVIYSEQRTMDSTEYAKAVLPSGTSSEKRADVLNDNVMDRPACFWFWAELSRRKIILHANCKFRLNHCLCESAGTRCGRDGKTRRKRANATDKQLQINRSN